MTPREQLDKRDLRIRKIQYQKGARVRVDHFDVDNPDHDDNKHVPPGTYGTTLSVDDGGTIHVAWDNERNLGLLDVDDFDLVQIAGLKFVDANGTPIQAGDWVDYDGTPCQIISTTEPDGDNDDEGRPYGIDPTLMLRFLDCEPEETLSVSTSWTGTGYWDDPEKLPYKCDEVIKEA